MATSIYLINPAPDFPSYFNSEVFERASGRPVASVVTLALPTVAAMVPDDFRVMLCDECATPIDFDTPAKFVGITGNISQWARMKEIARTFRERGKVVIIGGPQATLRSDMVRPHCDILVRGELEEIATELFDDLRSGTWQAEYEGKPADLTHAPLPRLDLYPNDRTLTGAIQMSRGCPFRCEFCEVIQYHGRRQRHKTVRQVLEELDQLYAIGYRQVFIADDNLTANRRRAKELLSAIADWNHGKQENTEFASQISIDATADDELLRLCADAGLVSVFVGIETPNGDSLEGVGKHQNLKNDTLQQIERFAENGIAVMGGMVVGFDSDHPDIFRHQYEFAMSTPVPIFTPVTLFAHVTTPLYARFHREGRIAPGNEERPFTPWDTNIIPRGMTREELFGGLRWLVNKLYEPQAFAKRVLRLAEVMGRGKRSRSPRMAARRGSLRPVDRECLGALWRLALLGFAEARLVARLLRLVIAKPRMAPMVVLQLISYAQFRHVFQRGGYWDPALARLDDPRGVMRRDSLGPLPSLTSRIKTA